MPNEPHSSDRFSVLHIEDDPFWLDHVAKLLAAWPEFRSCGTAKTGQNGMVLSQQLIPDIVLLDLRLPDVDGLEVVSALTAQPDPPAVLAVSCRTDDVTLRRLEFAPVSGMIGKTPGMESQLRNALAAIARGDRYFSPEIRSAIQRVRTAPDAFHKILSDREQEVLRLVAQGYSDSEIAATIGVGRATAHTHRQSLMDKLGIHSSTKLLLWAREKGFA